MNTRDPYYIITILILLALLVWSWSGDSTSKEAAENDARYLAQIAHKDQEIALRNKFLQHQDSSRSADNALHKHTQDSLNRLISRLKGKTIATSVLAATSPDTCKHLISQLYVRDSTITHLQASGEDFKIQVVSQVESYERSMDSLSANVEAEREKFEIADEARDSLMNIKPDSPWGVGITAGAGALVTPSGSFHGGFGAMAGITYRLPIKRIRLFKRRK